MHSKEILLFISDTVKERKVMNKPRTRLSTERNFVLSTPIEKNQTVPLREGRDALCLLTEETPAICFSSEAINQKGGPILSPAKYPSTFSEKNNEGKKAQGISSSERAFPNFEQDMQNGERLKLKAIGSSKKGKRLWTETEDKVLRELVSADKKKVWWDIALALQKKLKITRSGKQCRERYYLIFTNKFIDGKIA